MSETRIDAAGSFTVLSSLLAHLVVQLDRADVISGEVYADHISSAFSDPALQGAARLIADAIRDAIAPDAPATGPKLRIVRPNEEG